MAFASASRSSATLSNAASDSQRSRTAPPPSGGCWVQPRVRSIDFISSTALPCSASVVARALVRRVSKAWRTSGRS